MMLQIIEIAISAFDIYVIATFYYRRLEKQVSVRAIVLCSAACAALQYGMLLLRLPAYLNIASSVAVCFLMALMFHASWKQRLFYPLVITSLGIVAEMAAGFLLSALCRMTVNEIIATPHDVKYLVGSITAKLVFFIFVRVLCRLHVMNDSTLPLRHWLLIMMVPVTSVAVCCGLAFSADRYIISDPAAPFLFLAGILGVNVLAFIMYDELSVQSKALVEHERAKYRMEADRRRYEDMITQSRELAATLHDTQKHCGAVYDLLAAGDSPAAMRYIENMHTSGAMRNRENGSSSNAVVSTILRRKTDEAGQYGIEVTCNFEAASPLPIDEVSLCLILGNALDNAIEACRKLPECDKRLIEIDVRYQNDRLTIRVANASKPVEIINNACATTKRNTILHGYGLPNIQKAVAENGGNSVIRCEGGMFILSVIFLL